jgi:RHS repeat-associated protein
VQTLSFYPYGATRLSAATSTNEKRKWIGQFLDDSSLVYDNARYYNSNQGQFLGEEPIFVAMGDRNRVSQLAQQDQQIYLRDPQQLNSYAYGRDNPVSRKDITGRQADPISVTVELTAPEWVPTLSALARPVIAGIGSFITANVLARTSNSGKYGPYPGPGMDYQTSKLVTENSGRTDPPGPNGNWKGIGATIGVSSAIVKWITDYANGGNDGPTNFDWIYAIYQNVRGNGQSSNLGLQFDPSKQMQMTRVTSPQYNNNGKSAASSGWYGKPGTVYTNYVAGNAHTACGSICR